MKKLVSCISNCVTEARRSQSEVDKMPTNLKKIEGEEAEQNGSHGLYAVEPPSADLLNKPIPKDKMTPNMKKLAVKFASEEDFFVQGRAGWGKTAIITSMAHRYGYTVLTVYLDKAVASDLGGIPVPVEDKKTKAASQKMAMPAWGSIMLKNPKTKFLLFFDEMNQAAPDVQNALMPIVLKHEICGIKFENFFVGAAGNLQDENFALSDLSGPLKSRFKPLIKWQDGDWGAAFEYIIEKWKDKVPVKLMEEFKDNAALFVNPREVETRIIKNAYKIRQMNEKNSEMGHEWDADVFYDRLLDLSYADGDEGELKHSDKDSLLALADMIYEWTEGNNDNAESQDSTRHFSGDLSSLNKREIKKLQKMAEQGYYKYGSNTYGVSRENIKEYYFGDDDENDKMNAEMWEALFDKWEAEDVKFKYQTDAEWKKEHKDWLEP